MAMNLEMEDGRLAHPKPQSGERIQPTAQAVGENGKDEEAPEGRKSNLIHDGKLWVAQRFPALRSRRTE